MYKKIIKWWLTGILLYFPFFYLFFNSTKKYRILSYLVTFIDEITIVICFLIGLRELYKNKEILNRSYLIIAIPIIVFFLYGLMSGIINGNRLIITILGTFDYLKYFLVIFIYAAFFREVKDFQKIFRLLLIFVIFLSGTAIIEEIWALVSRHILGKELFDQSMYLFKPPPISKLGEPIGGAWRFGVYKAGSIIQHSHLLGYLNLLILTIYIYLKRKINPWVLFILIGGILSTATRSSYASLFILLTMVFITRTINSKKIVTAFVVFAIVVIAISSVVLPEIDTLGNVITTYRQYARAEGMKIWGDHFLIGVGPGMFGGIISIMFDSKVYGDYNFNLRRLTSIGGIDQFWPQLFAEIGFIGFILFAGIIMAVIILLLTIRQRSDSNDIKGLQTALLIFFMTIYVYTFGTGFNVTAVIFPYFAFVGIFLGCVIGRMKTAT